MLHWQIAEIKVAFFYFKVTLFLLYILSYKNDWNGIRWYYYDINVWYLHDTLSYFVKCSKYFSCNLLVNIILNW